MNALSLSPRFDLFRLTLPKEFIPNEIHEKWYKLLNQYDKQVFREPIDIINESIQGVNLAGVGDGGIEQHAAGRNEATGRVEPISKVTYRNSTNPLDMISNEITLTFRHTQGFYTYFLLYECWFYHYCKANKSEWADILPMQILDESGVPISQVIFRNPVYTAIDGLDLSFSKVERGNDTFTCTFKYSDIDFDIIPNLSR